MKAPIRKLGSGRQSAHAIASVTLHTSEQTKGRESDHRLAAIVESSDDAIISKNLDGIITSWNRGAQAIFGYTASEAIGQPILMLIPEGREHEETEILARIRSGEKVDHFETQRCRKDGAVIYMSVTISPVRDAHGVIIGASKVARDITLQKKLQLQVVTLALKLHEAKVCLDAQVEERTSSLQSGDAVRFVSNSECLAALSARERKVLELASSGLLDKQIALAMDVSINTLKTYWIRIRSKIGNQPKSALAVTYAIALNSPGKATIAFEPDWEVEIEAWTFRRLSVTTNPFNVPLNTEVLMEDLIARVHWEDRARFRAMYTGLDSHNISQFCFIARLEVPGGVQSISAIVQVIRDDGSGKAIKVMGKHSSIFDTQRAYQIQPEIEGEDLTRPV